MLKKSLRKVYSIQVDKIALSYEFKTLLLDLDETLIHSCTIKENPEKIIKAVNDYGDEATLGLNIRPYCQELLAVLSQYYEIFIFTASSANYANAIVKVLDPFEKYILGILTRENCMETKNGFYIKDLRIIKNREIKNMVLVDNLSHSFGFQIDNGIPILEWHNDAKDQELKHLINYLITVAFVESIPEHNRKHLRLHELASCTPQELLLE